MWGTWFITMMIGLGAVLLLIALAFGTAGLVFGILIVGAVGVVIAVLIGFRRSGRYLEQQHGPSGPSPPAGGAPVSGEGGEPAPGTGSGSPTSARAPQT